MIFCIELNNCEVNNFVHLLCMSSHKLSILYTLLDIWISASIIIIIAILERIFPFTIAWYWFQTRCNTRLQRQPMSTSQAWNVFRPWPDEHFRTRSYGQDVVRGRRRLAHLPLRSRQKNWSSFLLHNIMRSIRNKNKLIVLNK